MRSSTVPFAVALLFACVACASGPARAQASFSLPGAADPALSRPDVESLVESLAGLLADGYVDSARGARAAHVLREGLRAKRYRGFDRPRPLVEKLVGDVQAVIHDGHFNILYFPPAAPGFSWVNEGEGPPGDSTRIEEGRRRLRPLNFGVAGARVLEGNIGYLDLTRFDAPPELYREPLASAFDLVRNTDALIVDLRRNPGGLEACVQLAYSHFVDGPAVVTCANVNRQAGTREEFRTVPDPGGAKYLGRPVYVLTSPSTASGAEMFSYQMQTRGRAVIVGARTAGGAHSFDTVKLGAERMGNVMVMLPNARIVDALTGTNWEGVGVIPDRACPPGEALALATRLAVDTLRATASDADARRGYRDLLDKLEYAATHAPPGAAELARYAGRYGIRRVFVEGDRLLYQREQGPLVEMEPVGPDTFELSVSMSPRPRVRFEVVDGRARALNLASHGGEERIPREP